MLSATKKYSTQYPVATKRVLRAMLKTVDLCVSDPKRVAKLAVESGFAGNYDYALQAMNEVRYDVWRQFDPEDSLRFYGLRMPETGLIDRNPNDLIKSGADWRFLNELKRELRA